MSNDENYFILSKEQNTVLRLKPDGSFFKKIGGKGWGNLNFNNPTSFFSPDGLNLYVADCYNGRILRFNRNLEYLNSFISNKDIDIKYPYLVGVDNFSNLFVFDLENLKFLKFTKDKILERSFGEMEFTKSNNSIPFKIKFDSNNNLITTDGKRILIYSNWGFLLNEIKIDSIIISFELYKDVIFILTNNRITLINENGEMIESYRLQEFIPDMDGNKIVDLEIQNSKIYLLSDAMIFKLPIETLYNWKRK